MLVHGRPSVYWDDGFGGWQAVAQSTVWSDGVVVSPPLFDDDLSLFEGIEDLPIQQFVFTDQNAFTTADKREVNYTFFQTEDGSTLSGV